MSSSRSSKPTKAVLMLRSIQRRRPRGNWKSKDASASKARIKRLLVEREEEERTRLGEDLTGEEDSGI